MNFGNPYPYMQQTPQTYIQPRQQMDYASQMQTTPAQQGFIVRPVASMEEAKAVPTDFSGNVTVMTDFSHGMIYTKTLNYQDGTSVFNCYRLDNTPLQPAPQITQPTVDYVTRKEFEALRAEIARMMEADPDDYK